LHFQEIAASVNFQIHRHDRIGKVRNLTIAWVFPECQKEESKQIRKFLGLTGSIKQ
jgi:hypothetical protein